MSQSDTIDATATESPTVDICFEGLTLPRMFDSLRSCKGKGIITFNPHEITVVGAEYKNNNDETPENLISVMEFSLSHHQADHYRVNRAIKRKINLSEIIKILNAKAFKSKANDPVTLTLQIYDSAPDKMIMCLKRKRSIGSGEAVHEILATETLNNDIEYSHDYHKYCARVMSSSDIKDKINSLVTNSHKMGAIKITSEVIVLTGEGDGREYAKSGSCKFIIPSPIPLELRDVKEAQEYTAEGVFELAKLKGFVRLSALSKEVIMYVEDHKPLLLEYLVDQNDNKENCDQCDKAEITRGAYGYVRYILEPQ